MLFAVLAAAALAAPSCAPVNPMFAWLDNEVSGIATDFMFANIEPVNSTVMPGGIVAAVSKEHPNYWYLWQRDSALVMDTLVTMYENGDDSLEPRFWRYADLIHHFQTTQDATQFAQAKFEVNGTGYAGQWCNPQYDGPALGASTLMRFANAYVKKTGRVELVKTLLYAGDRSIIKNALAYVAANWDAPGCCLWEEVRSADHFYTRMVQRRAFVEGHHFAKQMNDKKGAKLYKDMNNLLSDSLDSHFNETAKHIVETPSDTSRTGLNAGTFLGVIHTDRSDYPIAQFSPIDDRVLVSIPKFMASFRDIYAINNLSTDATGGRLGLALGRYPEDVYDGYDKSQGNPWFLCTNAIAELYFRAVKHYKSQGFIDVTVNSRYLFGHVGIVGLSLRKYDASSEQFKLINEALVNAGLDLVRRVKFHSDNGRLPEEFNRTTGHVQGAVDLTWSYASIFTVSWALKAATAA